MFPIKSVSEFDYIRNNNIKLKQLYYYIIYPISNTITA